MNKADKPEKKNSHPSFDKVMKALLSVKPKPVIAKKKAGLSVAPDFYGLPQGAAFANKPFTPPIKGLDAIGFIT